MVAMIIMTCIFEKTWVLGFYIKQVQILEKMTCKESESLCFEFGAGK